MRHAKSSTLAALSSYEKMEHARKFLIAQENYITKWGAMPEGLVRQWPITIVEAGAGVAR